VNIGPISEGLLEKLKLAKHAKEESQRAIWDELQFCKYKVSEMLFFLPCLPGIIFSMV
jgi:hypothetical protein